MQPLPSAGEDQGLPGLHPPPLAGRKGKWDLDGLGEVQVRRLRAWHPFILPPLIPFLSLLKGSLSHRPLANCHSGEQLFTQDVRPEQLLEGKVRPPLGRRLHGPQYGLKSLLRPLRPGL